MFCGVACQVLVAINWLPRARRPKSALVFLLRANRARCDPGFSTEVIATSSGIARVAIILLWPTSHRAFLPRQVQCHSACCLWRLLRAYVLSQKDCASLSARSLWRAFSFSSETFLSIVLWLLLAFLVSAQYRNIAPYRVGFPMKWVHGWVGVVPQASRPTLSKVKRTRKEFDPKP